MLTHFKNNCLQGKHIVPLGYADSNKPVFELTS